MGPRREKGRGRRRPQTPVGRPHLSQGPMAGWGQDGDRDRDEMGTVWEWGRMRIRTGLGMGWGQAGDMDVMGTRSGWVKFSPVAVRAPFALTFVGPSGFCQGPPLPPAPRSPRLPTLPGRGPPPRSPGSPPAPPRS